MTKKKSRKSPSLSLLRRKADTALQDRGRRQQRPCEACGKRSTVLHHHIPKSRSAALRYDLDNLVYLCMGCHFAHHNGDIRMANNYRKLHFSDWEDMLIIRSHALTKLKRQDYLDLIEKYAH
jgi:5-methylcytosine-specific restriction endonuclease McrA